MVRVYGQWHCWPSENSVSVSVSVSVFVSVCVWQRVSATHEFSLPSSSKQTHMHTTIFLSCAPSPLALSLSLVLVSVFRFQCASVCASVFASAAAAAAATAVGTVSFAVAGGRSALCSLAMQKTPGKWWRNNSEEDHSLRQRGRMAMLKVLGSNEELTEADRTANWLTDWLTDWLNDWLTNWLTDRLLFNWRPMPVLMLMPLRNILNLLWNWKWTTYTNFKVCRSVRNKNISNKWIHFK